MINVKVRVVIVPRAGQVGGGGGGTHTGALGERDAQETSPEAAMASSFVIHTFHVLF